MKWIRGPQQGSPSLAHVELLAVGPLPLSRIVIVHSTRRALQVEQLGKRCPDNPITMISKSQAKINVVKGNWQIDFIQPSDFEESPRRIATQAPVTAKSVRGSASSAK